MHIQTTGGPVAVATAMIEAIDFYESTYGRPPYALVRLKSGRFYEVGRAEGRRIAEQLECQTDQETPSAR